MATNATGTAAYRSEAANHIFGWVPQGDRRILIVGDPTLADRHKLVSPSSTYVSMTVEGIASRGSDEDERHFDAVIWSDQAKPDAKILTHLRCLCATPAALVMLTDTVSVAGPALASAGWHVLDQITVASSTDQVPAGMTGTEPETATSMVVLRAISGPIPKRLTVAALGMRKVAGVTDARIDHPMAALASRPTVRAVWGAGAVDIPRDWPPGLLILHRQFLDSEDFVNALEKRIKAGWLIVSEIDDDPRHWPQFGKAEYRAFRGVHAVAVSTPPLAQMIRQWNPNIAILPNGIAKLPKISETTPKSRNTVRVFFGALNREKDWLDLIPHIRAVGESLDDLIEFVVVHDRQFFDQLGEVRKVFHPTLPLEDYMAQLALCDVSLLPLSDTPFNRLKSDLKFIESCAAGAVPIASPVLYAANRLHRDIAVFADRPEAWGRLLRRLAENPEELAIRRQRGLDYVRTKRMHADGAEARENLYRTWFEALGRLEAQRRRRLCL